MKVEMIATTRGVTHIKGDGQKPEVVAVKYGIDAALPVLIFEDEIQGYSFEVIITEKIKALLRKAAEI